MENLIKISLPPKLGDFVLYEYPNLGGTQTGSGKVIGAGNGAVEVLPTDSDEPITVFADKATVVVKILDYLDYLKSQFRLIAAQEQGCGGTATIEQCWANAKSIAVDAEGEIGRALDLNK